MTRQPVVARLALEPGQLRRRLDPQSLPFETTAEVAPLVGTIGQPRALAAIDFALDARSRHHHLFVAGAPGSGRESTVLAAATAFAADQPAPSDWVYVHNFAQPDQPAAIPLAAGRGRAFASDMRALIEAIQREIPRAFEHEDFERRKQEVVREANAARGSIMAKLREYTEEREFAVEMTPTGIVSVALLNGQPLRADTFEKLPEDIRKEIDRRSEEVQAFVGGTVRQLRQLEKETAEHIRQLERDVVLFTVGPFFEDLQERYDGQAKVLAFLAEVKEELPEHLGDFLPGPDTSPEGLLGEQLGISRQDHLARYQVNVFIDHGDAIGAPVVIERNPTYANLIGRIDHRAVFGAMVTDFRHVRPGALHRANGGVLVMHVVDLLTNPFSWDALKRALISGEVQIENLAEQYAALPTTRLRPEPIPLDIRIVLIGSPLHYQLLYGLDEDFRELFAVRADFAPDMAWTDENIANYAAFVSRQVHDNDLLHFDRAAVARVAEHGARVRDHQRRLSARLVDIANVVIEASYWAGKNGHELVRAGDVDQAVAQRDYRANLVEERYHSLISEGTLVIDTSGARVGQVNGLSIADLGDYTFGVPARITARTSFGRGTIQSIEREIELSGPIHTKGFLILTGYLQAQYAQEWPLALGATITFEQSYDEVEGDSASSTELYALLSALADLPLRQDIAVTGAVNQHGEVRAVGGVTRKIEGFFAVCRERGLTGSQGVIIPAANAQHLMLADDIIDAVRAGDFHIWAVNHIDEGIELLTGTPAGARGAKGRFPRGSVHAKVESRLRRYAEQSKAFAVPQGERDAADGQHRRRAPATTGDRD